MPPWTLKTALALFSGSVVLGWIFHMNVVVKINKGDFHNVYRGAQRWLLALQILCCLAGVGLLIIFSFGAIRPPYEQTAPALAPNSNWRPTGRGTTRGISGLALLQQERGSVSFLAVLDNKRADESRLMRLTARAGQAPQSQDLAWPGFEPPKDLEALTRVPGDPSQFFAITSAGRLYHLRAIDQANAVELLGESDLLNAAETPEIEAFRLTVCWAASYGHLGRARGWTDCGRSLLGQIRSLAAKRSGRPEGRVSYALAAAERAAHLRSQGGRKWQCARGLDIGSGR